MSLRTCSTCKHGEKLSTAEFRERMTQQSPSLGAPLSLADLPHIKDALARGTKFVRCRRQGLFTDEADSCGMHELVGIRSTLRRVLFRESPPVAPPVAPPAPAPPPVARTPFDEGKCFACGLEHDKCRSCQQPRGLCGICTACRQGVLYSIANDAWRCSGCKEEGKGKHPSMPLAWQDGFCDGCRAREGERIDAPSVDAPGVFGGARF